MFQASLVKHSQDRSIAQSFDFNGFTPLPWDDPQFDIGGAYDAEAPSRLYCTTDGVYLVVAQANYSTTGLSANHSDWGIALKKNAQYIHGETQFGASGNYWPAIQAVYIDNNVAGDFWEVVVEQKSGTSRVMQHTASWFALVRLGP